MARPKPFDQAAALQQAVGVFWKKGYAATSITELVEAMGINAPSLYATYGDKRCLFLTALRSYQQSQGERFIALRKNRLQHKVALVTGGNSGIGLATAKEFIAQGAKVIITGRNAAVAEATAGLGEHAVGIVSDAGKLTDVHRLPDLVQSHFPRIDVLFINAGIAQFAPLAEVSESVFHQTMGPNSKGACFTIQALLPLMADGGSIILNTSINAHIGMPGASIYAASKAALISLARNLSAELLPRRIRVNAISPGPVETPLHSTGKLGISERQLQQMGDHILSQLPIGRFGTSEEIAKAALFFASDDSSFVLEAELIADGGIATL